MTAPADVVITRHAHERITERLDATVSYITALVAEANRECRFSRHKPNWMQRYYGTGSRGMHRTESIRYLRFVDDGHPACVVVSLPKDQNRVIVVTVMREDERTRGMQHFHATFNSADRERPGGRRRHRARFGDRGSDQ